MSSAPSLALRSLLISVLGHSGLASPTRRISGATAPVRAMAVAAAARGLRDGVVLHVVPNDADIETAVSDIRFFLGALEGTADAVIEQQVLPFPSPQVDPYRGFQPHLKVASARARVLHALATAKVRVIVASAAGLLTRVPDPAALLMASYEITPGIDIDPQALANTLVAGGYEPADPVDAHGEFARRGGILDVFPAGEELPIRIEFIGDTVESIRRFDPGTQRSVETLERFGLVPVREGTGPGTVTSDLFEFLSTHKSQVWLSEPADVQKQIESAWEQVQTSYSDAVERSAKGAAALKAQPSELMLSLAEVESGLKGATVIEELGIGDPGSGIRDRATELSVQPVASFHGRIADWVADVRAALERADRVVFVAGTHGRAERTVELLRDYDVRAVMANDAGDVVSGAVLVAEGWLSRGFRLKYGSETDDPQAARTPSPQALQLYVETDIFDEERRKTSGGRKRSLAATFLSDLRDLKVKDLIVHVDHGIGQFIGLKQISIAGGDIVQEFLELQYHGDAKLFVPVERLDLIQKYTGAASQPLVGLVARPGRRPSRRSRKPCATWPKSCSSSTPRARRCRVTRSAPTRTGRRSSKPPSSSISPWIRRLRSPTSSATWSHRRPWTACCAVTSAMARPK